ncbi:hypothetical protein [Kitasatospora sp. NPDC088783]
MNENIDLVSEDDEATVTVIGDAAALTMGGQADGGEGKRFVYSYAG